MNSSINPSSESLTPASDSVGASEFGSNRQQPIPPPSEPMQYRAIGLVRGRYSASAEQFTQGTLRASDGTEINAVLLGRIMSLVKNHIDLAQDHLWVVYPRSGQQDQSLHLQIVGVWEPERLNKQLPDDTRLTSQQLSSEPEIQEDYFSIRGEVVYQCVSDGSFVVKIKQAPRKESEPPKYFKLKLQGDLANKAVGKFWDLQVKRHANTLVLQASEAIAVIPSKPKIKKSKLRPDGHVSPKRNTDVPRPVRQSVREIKQSERPILKQPSPKPIKRPKP